jgi:hypothetical protein
MRQEYRDGGSCWAGLWPWIRLVDVRLPYAETVAAVHDYSELHEIIDRLEPEQAEELREHALRLVTPPGGRFKVLRSFNGPSTDLGARAREVLRAEFGRDHAEGLNFSTSES